MKNNFSYFKGLFILVGLVLTMQLSAQKVEFENPYLLKADGKMINTGGITYASPCYGDYDGDGKAELLLGFWNTRKEGHLIIFENKGSKKKPEFTKKGLLEINDKPAYVGAY